MTRDEAMARFDALLMTVTGNELAVIAVNELRVAYQQLEEGVELAGDPLAFADKLAEARSWQWKARDIYSSITAYCTGGILGTGYLTAALSRYPELTTTETLEKALRSCDQKRKP